VIRHVQIYRGGSTSVPSLPPNSVLFIAPTAEAAGGGRQRDLLDEATVSF
jgi:hypothetical protein